MVFIVVKGDIPNKQRQAHERKGTQLVEKLELVKEQELGSKIIEGPVSLEFNLYMIEQRYVKKNNDHLYIGDIDNLLSGIMDELKGRIIIDDDQVMEITAKKNIIDDEKQSYYTITIQP